MSQHESCTCEHPVIDHAAEYGGCRKCDCKSIRSIFRQRPDEAEYCEADTHPGSYYEQPTGCENTVEPGTNYCSIHGGPPKSQERVNRETLMALVEGFTDAEVAEALETLEEAGVGTVGSI